MLPPPSPGPPPVQHRGRVEPVRLRVVEDRNAAPTLRTVAYRAHCSCGWLGEYEREWREAVIALGEHKLGGSV
jgi:hypothetical protein